jgi:F0F1-type ATP synthase membrane subunit b/b'
MINNLKKNFNKLINKVRKKIQDKQEREIKQGNGNYEKSRNENLNTSNKTTVDSITNR